MKNFIYVLLIMFIAFGGCNNDEGLTSINDPNIKSGNKKDMVTVYHYDKELESWKLITINGNALPAHLAQGGYLATYVPDDNFEQALIDLGLDTPPLDDYVPTKNINTVTNLSVEERNISDLTGIEDFLSLTELNCWGNQLASLDLSGNTALLALWCNSNQLANLDVSNNTDLEMLICCDNQLTSLDVTNNHKLVILNFYSNIISNIDLSNNPDIIEIECNQNNLTCLDVSNVTALTKLMCYRNQLTSLNVSNITSLTEIACFRNQLTSLNVSSNTALESLGCNFNNLTSLDVSDCPQLIRLRCRNNQLTTLDVSANPLLELLDCRENPGLNCIQVNAIPVPPQYSKDPGASFSLDCVN